MLILVGETAKLGSVNTPKSTATFLLILLTHCSESQLLGFINICSTKAQNPLLKSLSLLHVCLRLPYQVLVTQAELVPSENEGNRLMHSQTAAKKDMQHFRAVFWGRKRYSVFYPFASGWYNQAPFKALS